MLPSLIWYGRQDLNLHGNPLEPKGDVTLVKVFIDVKRCS